MALTRRSLLRRLREAPGAALLSTRAARAAKALAVVTILVAALCSASVALAEDATPAPTTSTPTTPEAPPPDPYQAPKRSSKPKAAQSRAAAHVVWSAPIVRSRSYSPPPVSASRVHRSAKVVHKKRSHVVQRHAQPKPAPARVSLPPTKAIMAAAEIPLPSADADKDPYLWLAGVALALVAVAGLSLQLLSARFLQARGE
jgi:hypothetical protein